MKKMLTIVMVMVMVLGMSLSVNALGIRAATEAGRTAIDNFYAKTTAENCLITKIDAYYTNLGSNDETSIDNFKNAVFGDLLTELVSYNEDFVMDTNEAVLTLEDINQGKTARDLLIYKAKNSKNKLIRAWFRVIGNLF